MNEIQIFHNEDFGDVRTKDISGEAYFCLPDVCRILEIKNVSDCKSRLNKKGVVITDTLTNGGNQKVTFISESNLYKVIFQSRKPSAEKFTDWVTSEVIPSIRKNGGYIENQENLTPEQIVANALVVAQKIIADRDKQIQEMKPKADFFDAVADSKDAIEMGRVAKVLNYPGIGRNKLFEMLRDKGVLMNGNIPYQKFIDRGYFRTIEQKFTKPDGSTNINIKTLVYQKGVDAIRRMLDKYAVEYQER